MLHNRLGQTLLRYVGIGRNTGISGLVEGQLRRIAYAVKHFELAVTGTLGFDNAQVTAGGIKTEEFNPQTLESLPDPQGFMLLARCWISMVIAVAIIYSGPGPAADFQGGYNDQNT